MKKLVILMAVSLISIASFAQTPKGTTFGIFGGYTSSSTKVSDWSAKNAAAYQAGIADSSFSPGWLIRSRALTSRRTTVLP